MPKYNISDIAPSVAIQGITVEYSVYDTGHAILIFNKEFVKKERMLNIRYDVDKIIKQSNVCLTIYIINFFDITHLRPVRDYLVEQKLLTIKQRQQLQSIIEDAEKTLPQSSKLKYNISSAQEEILKSLDEIYIEDIIENAGGNYQLAVKLLAAAFNDDNQTELDPQTSFHGTNLVKEFLLQNNVNQSCHESISALWRLYSEHANLASTYLRLNKELLPNISMQRYMIFDHCIAKLKESFNGLDDADKLYMILQLLLFKIKGQRVSFSSDLSKIVINALHKKTTIAEEKAFTGNSLPMVSLLGHAFRYMGMVADNKFDVDKIKSLKQQVKAPLINDFLADVEYSTQVTKKKENTSSAAQLIKMSTFSDVTTNAHQSLMNQIHSIIQNEYKVFGGFINALNERAYAKGLRRICTCSNEQLFPIILKLTETLLAHKSQLSIAINEQAGDKSQAAIHYAALKGNWSLYDILVKEGANPNLPDKDGITAEQIKAKYEIPKFILK